MIERKGGRKIERGRQSDTERHRETHTHTHKQRRGRGGVRVSLSYSFTLASDFSSVDTYGECGPYFGRLQFKPWEVFLSCLVWKKSAEASVH